VSQITPFFVETTQGRRFSAVEKRRSGFVKELPGYIEELRRGKRRDLRFASRVKYGILTKDKNWGIVGSGNLATEVTESTENKR